jgi:GT2 family glycosyltransferase
VRCSVIVPVYGQAALTRQCLDILLAGRNGRDEPEVVVVDDGSTDDTPELLGEYGDRIRVVHHERNLGFATACNDGAAAASGEVLVFLNNDTIPQPGWLDALVRITEDHPRAAVVGAKLLFPDDTVQHAGVVICQYGYPKNVYAGFPAWHPAVNQSRRFQAVTAACMLVRRELFEEVGGFDTEYRNGFEDVDLCLRLGERGYEVHYCHESVVYHLESMSAGRFAASNHNREVYERRWRGRVHSDDFRYYTADGLIGIRYEDQYPLRIDLSPLLGVVEGDELTRRADALLGLRSRRNIELLREIERLNVRLLEALGGEAGPSARLVEEGSAQWLTGAPKRPLVSVVLPVRDGEEWLEDVLPRLAEQDAGVVVELVGVDCGSRDGSVERLRTAEARIVAVDAPSPGAIPLAATTKYARGDLVVLLQQGILPADGSWLSALIGAFGDGAIVAACSRLEPPSGEGFHGAATAFRPSAFHGDVRLAELGGWATEALSSKLRIEPSAVALRPADGDELAGLVDAIRDDWRSLDGLELEWSELEKARAEAALRRVVQAVGRSLGVRGNGSNERLWIEDAKAGKLAAGSWANGAPE